MGRKKVERKIYVCHKCGKARRTEPKRLKWPRCSCIGQTTFDYERIGRTVEEAKELLESAHKKFTALYKIQECEQYEFDQLDEEYRLEDE